MDRTDRTAELKRRAVAAGFDRVGVARATRLERDAATLDDWLARGRHAGMEWMTRAPSRRADPRQLLPGCRSVVVLASNYWPGADEADCPPGRARVALYARGRDYHKVLGREARALATWLDETGDAVSRAFVDTGPVLERAWAERAGIGWIGKNACLIDRRLGSWLLLAEVLTTEDLEPDPGPHVELCGSCNACIEACPTAAIVGDGVVDADRCIAYWSIEHRGTIPEARREGQGEWIFGCDVCQEVCPWNRRFARPVAADRFARRDDLNGLDPFEILAIDEVTFRRRFSGTALMRAKWEGMRRNACVVLGNRCDPAAADALGRALDDEDPVIRELAAWALERIERPAAGRPGDPTQDLR